MTGTRVVVADDHHVMLDRTAEVLGAECSIVARATDGRQAIEAARRLRPDVLVLDISMPVFNGFEVARQLKAADIDARVVFLTVHDDPAFVHEALNVGAFGFVSKSRIASDLLFAIKEACAGRSFTSPSAAP